MDMRMGTIGLATLALVSCAATAQARDACLVGSWSPVGNGAAEWIERNSRGMRLQINHQVARMRLDADGRYHVASEIDASSALGRQGARGTTTYAASGRWTSEGGKLTLTPSRTEVEGSVAIHAGDGRTTRMAIPDQGGGATTQAYRCSGDSLETRIQLPGFADPIVQRFERE